ncbi:hypothetical protein OIO90_003226 [Microbotryomycetes sp. JL221]|nr:hypothetical protein OIO90_003226 [Microbotryomycetes sp. JL221]
MVNIPLPTIRPGDDAINVLQQYLDDLLYRSPTPGFKARVAVLISLDCLYLLLDIVYLTLTVKRILRTKGKSGLWLFRKKKRANQVYFVSHVRLLRPLLTLCQGCFGIIWAVNVAKVYIYRSSQRHSWGLRSFQFLPIFVTGWMISAGLVQSYLLTMAETRKSRLSPSLINWTVIIVGIVLLFWQLGLGIWSTVRGWQLWDLYPIAQAEFERYRAEGRTDLSAIVELLPLYRAFLERADLYQNAMIAQFLSLWVLPFCAFALNLGGVLLARRLTREIKQKEIQFNRVQVAFSSIDTEDIPATNVNEKQDACVGGSQQRKNSGLSQLTLSPRLTNQELRTIVAQIDGDSDSNHQATALQAQEILDLRRASRDLWANTMTVLFASVLILGACVYLAWWVKTGRIITGSWPSYETALLLIQWMMSTLLCGTFIALLLTELKVASTPKLDSTKARTISFSSTTKSCRRVSNVKPYCEAKVDVDSPTASHEPGRIIEF